MAMIDLYGLVLTTASGIDNIHESGNSLELYNSQAQLVSGVLSVTPLGAVATSPAAGILNIVKISVDAQTTGAISAGDVLSLAGNGVALVGGIVALGFALPGVGLALGVAGLALTIAGQYPTIHDFKFHLPTGEVIPIGDANRNGIPDILESGINSQAKSANNAAKAVLPPRRDPLTLDLDGDGLETTAIAATNPILFDHDGDGVKNGTGWVKPDDGFLVRDVNGNGSIDNGRELFGDSTILTSGARAGQNALDGFDALSDLDSIANGGNADGKISNLDTQFSNLRIWRDLNQDGISQMGDSVTGLGRELFTLTELGIASINIAKTSNSQTLSNGNQIADIGSFTRTDGTQAAVGEVTGNLADINLASDTFHRSFTNVLDTTSVATLPDMQGSGKVRDLREAATQSTTLQSLLTQYSATTTRASQIALIDQLLDAWADTGGMAESLAQRVAGMTGYTRADGVVIPYTLSSNLTAAWIQKLHIIETFNGSYFYGLPGTTQSAGVVNELTTVANDAEYRATA